MYSLEIEGKKYQLDQEWNVNTWLQLHKWNPEEQWQWPKMIEIASGAPAELVAELDYDIQYEAILIVTGNMVPNWAQLQTKIGSYKLINIENLTIGQFVDLEVALSRGLEKNLDWLVSILYDCPKKDVLTWNYEWAFAALQTWYVHRKNILEGYTDLFELGEVEEDSRTIKVDPAHNWYDLLMVLAEEQFLNIHQVVDRPVHEALNFLAWKKDQAKKAELERKKLEMTRR